MSTDSGHIVEHFRARRRAVQPRLHSHPPSAPPPLPPHLPPAHPWIVMVVATTTNFGTRCHSHDKQGAGRAERGSGQVEGVIDLIERNWTGSSTSATGPCGTPPLNCSASPDSSR